ncbi:MAG TPA: porin [Buchnera sp. (in: enterobacteria)]|nr:porin [Buchnera sp. (in: enterobacteria)]
MINRISLLIMIPVLLIVSTVNGAEIYNQNGNKLKIYGGINQKHQLFNLSNNTNKKHDKDPSEFMLGLLGETKINNDFFGYSCLEYRGHGFISENSVENTNKNKVSLGLIGFRLGKWSSLDYGRNHGVIYEAKSLTDRHSFINTNNTFKENDIFLMDRASNVITYHNYNFFGLSSNVITSFQYQEKHKNSNSMQENGSGWGSSIKYNNKRGITAVASWFSENRTARQIIDGQGDSADAYGIGLKYKRNHVYMAAFYGEGRNVTPYAKFTKFSGESGNLELFGEYDFNCGLSSSLSYSESYGNNMQSINSNLFGKKIIFNRQLNVSSHYNFNKKIYTYIDYKFDFLKYNQDINVSDRSHDNIFSMGMVYKF